ncbi:MAG: glycosyltransferase, partial [Terrimicrobiaceae bacterium]
MKIAYAFNYYQQHGGENMWYNSEPDLFRARGHEVVIYSRDNKEIESYSLPQKLALFWQVAWSRKTYDDFSSLLRRERPDVVHVYNTLALISPAIFYACRDAGVPVVQTLYNYRLVCPAATLLREGKVCEECLDHSLLRSIKHRCYRDSALQSASLAHMIAVHRRKGTWSKVINGFIVPTAFMKAKLAQGGVPAEKIFVKPNWHDPDPGMRTQKGEFCLYVGRLSQEKGILTTLDAWARHKDLPPLVIAGDGPLKGEVEKRLRSWNGSPATYLGRISHEEVIGHMKRSICFLLPSEWYEAFPHTILEAYACGVPIVASRIGTLTDVIEDGLTGALYTSGDPDAMAEAVR